MGTVATPASVDHFAGYALRLSQMLAKHDWTTAVRFAEEMADCARTGRHVFIAGNGGSAGNAVHLANDLLYAWSKQPGRGIRVTALPANAVVMTCLANDEGYEEVFAAQLAVHARAGDVLIVLSGSGNSRNIVRALEQAKASGMISYAVVGFDGGKARTMSDVPIHFRTEDMQLAEDAQLILGHMVVQHLAKRSDLAGRK